MGGESLNREHRREMSFTTQRGTPTHDAAFTPVMDGEGHGGDMTSDANHTCTSHIHSLSHACSVRLLLVFAEPSHHHARLHLLRRYGYGMRVMMMHLFLLCVVASLLVTSPLSLSSCSSRLPHVSCSCSDCRSHTAWHRHIINSNKHNQQRRNIGHVYKHKHTHQAHRSHTCTAFQRHTAAASHVHVPPLPTTHRTPSCESSLTCTHISRTIA